ncbi:MAG: EAL domain-containing protein [Clostridia bacterium]|nr:EAL domain-containing protein [Clostridia bacterium]
MNQQETAATYSHGNINIYREVMEVINHSTDDFLFIYNIEKDEIQFFGNINQTYALRNHDSLKNTTTELIAVVHPADRKKLKNDLELIISGEKNYHNLDYRWITLEGKTVWINSRGTVLRNENGNEPVMLGRVSEEALRHLYNPLTGLWNKVKLREDLKDILQNQNGYLLLLDIDGLAAINLRHGRDYGDMLLKEVADLLDFHPLVQKAYHIDHNNYMAIVDSEQEEDAQAVFSDIQAAMVEKCAFTASAVPINREFFPNVSSILDSVNLTMKKAKQKKGDQVEFFSANAIDDKLRTLTLMETLQQSVQNGCEGFELFYQPQFKAGNYHLYAAEALLRYQTPNGDRVFPDEFIPLLEQSRLIDTVGLWVLEQALLQCKKWRKKLPDLHVSVNFSIVQFEDVFIAEKIMAILQKTEMPGEALTIEITESMKLQESKHFLRCVNTLRKLGIVFSIDDFGSGYSNLGYLKKLNVDEIKIDRMFVTGVEKNTYNHKLISNIIEFAKTSAIRVCCEGLETTRELAVLEGLQPDLLQGYFFAKPANAATIEKTYINDTTSEYAQYLHFIEKLYQAKGKMGIIYFDPKDILRENDVGLWIIRINEEDNYYEMHADETMERIMAVEQKFTPQECYEYWHSRIKPDYLDYVHQNVQIMKEIGKVVQLQYPWNHPVLGEVIVRCSGKRVSDADGMIVLEGYHRIISNVEGY